MDDETQPLLKKNVNSVDPTVIVYEPSQKRFLEQLKDPKCLAHRLIVLTLMCFLGFGMLFLLLP